MLSRDASYVSSSDSEAAETEVEYDLEVEGSPNTKPLMMNREMPMRMSRWQMRNGWLNMKKKEKRRKNLKTSFKTQCFEHTAEYFVGSR